MSEKERERGGRGGGGREKEGRDQGGRERGGGREGAEGTMGRERVEGEIKE